MLLLLQVALANYNRSWKLFATVLSMSRVCVPRAAQLQHAGAVVMCQHSTHNMTEVYNTTALGRFTDLGQPTRDS